jgi:hypothetical protein
VPIIFELTVLLAALMAFFGVWGLSRLPQLYFPAFKSPRFRRATDDGFFIIIEARDPGFCIESARQLLLDTNSTAVEEVKE